MTGKQKTGKPLHPGLRAVLEIGPVIGFVGTYLIFRDDRLEVGGVEYSGLVMVTALFVPVFLAAMAALWLLTGRVARSQIATAAMILVFGGMAVWLNDPRLLKMKPTVIYLVLALTLWVGLLRGQSWLGYILQDMIPLKSKGWMILTRRMTLLFALSAAANEVVWRTQSETFWVVFETVVMPIVILGFFLTQFGLFAEYAKLGPSKPSRTRRKG